MDTQNLQDSIVLNQILANQNVLLHKTLNFHWNVTGSNFGGDHAFFKDLYEACFTRIDDVAERIRAVGARPVGSMARYLQIATIAEAPVEIPTAAEMYRILAADWDAVITRIKEQLKTLDENSVSTRNFLEEMVTVLEKEHWMIKAHIAE